MGSRAKLSMHLKWPWHKHDGLPRLCVLALSFKGENMGLSRAGGQGPDLHVPFGDGARHVELQVRRQYPVSIIVNFLYLVHVGVVVQEAGPLHR